MQMYDIACEGAQQAEVLSHLSSDMELVDNKRTYIIIKSDLDWQTLREYFKEYGVLVSRRLNVEH